MSDCPSQCPVSSWRTCQDFTIFGNLDCELSSPFAPSRTEQDLSYIGQRNVWQNLKFTSILFVIWTLYLICSSQSWFCPRPTLISVTRYNPSQAASFFFDRNSLTLRSSYYRRGHNYDGCIAVFCFIFLVDINLLERDTESRYSGLQLSILY